MSEPTDSDTKNGPSASTNLTSSIDLNSPRESDSAVVLAAESVGKRYGNNWVLRDVSMQLRTGQVLALLGENGAGKSTFVKILSGAVVPDEGHLSVDATRIPAGRPDASRDAGIAMVYQELSVCDDLSIEDNIMLGREVASGGWIQRKPQREIVRDALTRLGHGDLDPSRLAGTLSVGAKQLVEIARALAGKAKVLILDEPTSSLPRADVEMLFAAVKKLASEGLAVIYISHFLEEVRQICDSYMVLRDGQLAGTGDLDSVDEPAIVRLMVGRNVDELYPSVPHEVGEPVLRIESLSGSPVPDDVSLDVRQGEIFGIAGLVGAGRTELARCLVGLDERTAGNVRFNDVVVASNHPRQAIAAGLAMVSEDRKGEGLAQNLTIRDNATLSRLEPYQRFGFLNESARNSATVELIDRLQVKTTGPDQLISDLSGGNQQKVAMARVLHQDARCWVLDEPTRGVDVGTKAEIYRLIGEVAASGTSVVFISSYFQELLHTCDRIAVMARGRLVDVRDAADWSEHELLLSAMGGSE